ANGFRSYRPFLSPLLQAEWAVQPVKHTRRGMEPKAEGEPRPVATPWPIPHIIRRPAARRITAEIMAMTRQVIVVGDKVLIKPEEEASKTPSGLYLPQGVAAKETVSGGYIVNVG